MPDPAFTLVKKVGTHDLPLPRYATPDASGMDMMNVEAFELRPGERRLVRTGYAVEIAPGLEGQIRPRSGLALKHGITVLNAPGTIDSDYRGEIGVLLINLGTETHFFAAGTRIAQLVIAPVAHRPMVPVHYFSETKRGTGGFGSTGE